MTKIVTIYKNIRETTTPFHKDILFILDRIKNGKSKDLINKIRKVTDKQERNELKKNLPSICFSGKFLKRNAESLQQHSGFICLDFDGYANKKDLLHDKERFCKDTYVFSCFISPSGNGLKVIVKIPPDPDCHVNYFKALQSHFDSPYFDKNCKDISRVCYQSYDPQIHINENSVTWDIYADIEYKEVDQEDPVTIPISDENKIVDILHTWWLKKYPMSEGMRNHNAYVLAMALNDYGVNKTVAQFMLHQYSSNGFSKREIDKVIDSAYKNKQNFGTKYYEDDEAISKVREMVRKGATNREVRKEFKTKDIDPDVIDSVVDRIKEDNSSKSFWRFSKDGKLSIVHIAFKEFLEEHGFHKYCPEGSRNYIFVKVTNNLVDHTSEKEIKDFVLKYLLDLGDSYVYNYFADKTRFFKEDFLSLLSTIDIYFIEDTKDTAYLYYRNCAVTITKNKITTLNYIDLGGYVWKDHVIPRNYNKCKVGDCEYKTFISNICAGDETRVTSMESTIGFMLHGYKNKSFCPASILCDEKISDNAEGGTGKGLFINALSQMKKVVTIDGKSFNFEKSFAYQLVSADTQILVFDDVRKNFNFERLFSVITEGLTLEKKNKDAIKIPFEKSPKIGITTNYAIRGSGNSFARRKWELELHQYYSKHFTPLDEFGRLMFGDWTEKDWCKFDNYMIKCLQFYIGNGLQESEFVNLKVRQLSAETCHDFIEWCGLIEGQKGTDLLKENHRLNKQYLYGEFTTEYPDYAPKSKMSISRTKFYKWLYAYALFKTNKTPEEGRDLQGRWITIKT
tara:strand:- start:9098 stop:11476 length:2379 start_codon:yes stop_codon:yes gene_type:complete